MKLKEGNKATAKLLTEDTTGTPSWAHRILKPWRIPETDQTSRSLEKVVSLIIRLNLTKDQNYSIRRGALQLGIIYIYPIIKFLK